MEKEFPFVSVIIPCRNEEKFISNCLKSIVLNDYPKEKMEVFVVDGMSADKTRTIIKEYEKNFSFIKLLNNPEHIIPTAMNIGINASKGETILKVDAHAYYPKEYISKCVYYQNEYNADNVGGIVETLPREDGIMGRSIVYALSSVFGVGNSTFRVGTKVIENADTVFSGCYKKSALEEVGLYNEKIERSEDVYINSRLKKSGKKILLVPDIKTKYFARSNYYSFVKHNYDNGFWTIYPLMFGVRVFKLRHIIPLLFIMSFLILSAGAIFSSVFFYILILIIASYSILNCHYSNKIAKKEKQCVYLFLMPIVYTTLHVMYGIGSFVGFIRVLKANLI